ncbi:MAG TPA: ATP-binding protein [Caulobacteraceae bacterium]|jgi:signal transduction histidine kinase|nr:ATP-binding protein [Caulobacteraceae bacterium]
MLRPELWRTTTFRLTLVFGAVFAAGVVTLLGLVYFSAAVFLTQQMDQIIVGQAHALQDVAPAVLPERMRQVETQDVRNVYFYGLFSPGGAWIAGNVRRLPQDVPANGIPRELREPGFQPGARAMAERLSSGEILFIGFDAKVLTGLRLIILQSVIWSGALIIVAGLGLGAALSLGPLRRIQAVQQASLPIQDGDLGARLPISNRGDEIDMLAGIANGMMDEVERLLWAVKSVGDNVAHDLRTPLTRLRAQLYRVRQETDAGDAHLGMLDQALVETDFLLARFKALQRISEIDRRERRAGFAAVRLQALVEEIGELYEPLAEEHGLTLVTEADMPCEIQADRELLFEAFSNLVGNAVKFTPAGGRVRLVLTKRAEGPRLEIFDSGPGVPEDEREAVLERFYRGRNRNQTPGSGLGLSIVAAVARLHDFRLALGDAMPGLKVTLDCWPVAMGR